MSSAERPDKALAFAASTALISSVIIQPC